MDNRTRLLLGGLKSAIPFLRPSYRGTGGTADARYCYSVWLRHLALARTAGLDQVPETVVEFGPGDSLGTGIAALLSGAQRYYALDVVDHASPAQNVRVFDELVALFRARAEIPAGAELSGVHPHLASYAFPDGILTECKLACALDERRLAALRALVAAPSADLEAPVRYVCPWTNNLQAIEPSSVDLVMSQVVLQEMEDSDGDNALTAAFHASATWLRPGGMISHQIDFRTPRATHWNEHWTFSDFAWLLARGRRQRFHNRVPLSRYLELCGDHGFRVATLLPIVATGGAPRSELAPRWRHLSDEDLTTSGAYLLAVKDA